MRIIDSRTVPHPPGRPMVALAECFDALVAGREPVLFLFEWPSHGFQEPGPPSVWELCGQVFALTRESLAYSDWRESADLTAIYYGSKRISLWVVTLVGLELAPLLPSSSSPSPARPPELAP